MGTHPIFESDFDCLTDMSFGDLSSAAGLEKLNAFLSDKSYISGYTPSQADVSVFNAIKSSPKSVEHVLRWWNHISSYKSEFASLTGAASVYAAGAAAEEEEEDDDDVDLFGSDDEDDGAAEKLKQERIAAYNARKAAKEEKKGKLIAKSSISLDVKPWDDETDMKELEEMVRGIKMDGLLWGGSKLVAVGYGIKKLQITCVVEDDKVGTDDLEDKITAFEDHVQSMDIASFQKI